MQKLLAGALAASLSFAVAQAGTSFPPQRPGSAAAPMTASGVYNANSQSLLHWRAAVGRVLAGTGRGRILILGDSTSGGGGAGSGGNTNGNGAWAKAWPRYLAAALAARGVPTSDLSLFGSQASPVAYGTYDTRANIGSWSSGAASYFTASAAATFAFTPSSQIDTAIVFYVKNGIFTANFNGGSTAFTSPSGGNLAYASSGALSTTLGSNTINLVWSSGVAYFGAILAYNSTVPAIDIMQRAIFGAEVSSFDPAQGSVYDGPNEIKAYAPDLTIINLTINDSNNNGLSYLSTYTSYIQDLINAAQVSGDVLLMVGVPSNTTNATNGTLLAYQQALMALAASNNAAFLSLLQRWGGYAITNPVMPYYDSLHPQAPGYSDIGKAVADLLTAQY